MLKDYTFNEEEKRFEPTIDECAYCHKEKMTNKEDCYYLPVYAERDRTYLIVYSSVKYAKVLLGIPRCASCHNIHESAKSKANLIGILIPVILIVFFTIIFKGPGFILSLFICPFIGIGFYELCVKQFITNKGINREKDIVEENEAVQDFLIAGWSLRQPEA